MRIKLFTIPLMECDKGEKEINDFCAAHSIATTEKHFVADGHNSFWAFCVTYAPGEVLSAVVSKGKVDYKTVLNEQDFQIFAKLRDLRKSVADSEGVPAYALFTNEQLAAIVIKKISSKSGLAAIEGVGPARIEKYGEQFIKMLRQSMSAQNAISAEDSGDEAPPA